MTGDSLIIHNENVRKLKDVANEQNNYVLSTDHKLRKYHSIVSKGIKPVYTVKLDGGISIEATEDHLFETDKGFIQTKDLKEGVNCKVLNHYPLTKYSKHNKFYEMLGWMHGDGWMTKDVIGISFNKKDGDFEHKNRLLDVFKDTFYAYNIKPLKDDDISYQLQVDYTKERDEVCKKYGIKKCLSTERGLPKAFYSWRLEEQLSFLKGLFAADGNIQGKGNNQVFLYSSSIELIKQVQQFLAAIGIISRKMYSYFGNKNRKPQYKCSISKNSANIFMDIIGFNGHKKANRFNRSNYSTPEYLKIKNIEENGEKEVFDINEVETTNTFFANGIGVHNCNLGSMNLSDYVVNPYASQAYFDYNAFKRDIYHAIRGLDDVLDEGIEKHALDTQKKMAKNYRNIGLGVMGIGNKFYKLGIKYGSEESKKIFDDIMYEKYRTAVFASNKLAKERGAFPKYDERIFDSKIIQNHFSEEEIEQLKVHGLRNASLLSIAPSGSIGTMLGISTGIEPLFQLKYTRKTESLHKDKEVYYEIDSEDVKKYKEINNTNEIPDHFVVADDIHWKNRIDMQAIAQNHVDTAISSTINLPEDATPEEIEELYLYGWEQGLKGCTIYRNGCKKGSILEGENTKEKEEGKKAKDKSKENSTSDKISLPWGTTIKATDDLIGRKRTIQSGCGKIHIKAFFSPDDGRLMEVFFSKGSEGVCSSWMTSNSRIISAALRTGMGFDYLIDQLKSAPTCPSYSVRSVTKKDTSKGNCCPTAVANKLEEMQEEIFDELGVYEEEREEVRSNTQAELSFEANDKKKEKFACPECGGELSFQGGCQSCFECGFSFCE